MKKREGRSRRLRSERRVGVAPWSQWNIGEPFNWPDCPTCGEPAAKYHGTPDTAYFCPKGHAFHAPPPMRAEAMGV